MKKWIALVLLICFIASAFAEIYQSTDEEGVVTYSDQPKQNAKPIILPPASISTPVAPQTITPALEKNTIKPKSIYKKFSIVKPIVNSKDNEVTFQNAEDILVELAVDPALTKEDTVQLLLDGNPVSKQQSSLKFIVPKVNEKQEPLLTRGTHTLQAVLLDKNQQTIATTPEITIYIHYASILNRPGG